MKEVLITLQVGLSLSGWTRSDINIERRWRCAQSEFNALRDIGWGVMVMLSSPGYQCWYVWAAGPMQIHFHFYEVNSFLAITLRRVQRWGIILFYDMYYD